jgi:hypothetical protein
MVGRLEAGQPDASAVDHEPGRQICPRKLARKLDAMLATQAMIDTIRAAPAWKGEPLSEGENSLKDGIANIQTLITTQVGSN